MIPGSSLGPRWGHFGAALLVLLLGTTVSQANSIRNPSFEDIPGPRQGEGFLPSEWVVLWCCPGADTYSNDGSYGLLPDYYGNFPGVEAFDGIRWVAGWSMVPESFGQHLTTPLSPDSTYELSVWLHAALRQDLAHPGSYEVGLAHDETLEGAVVLGQILPFTNDSDSWQERTIHFVPPSNAAELPVLFFSPIDSGEGTAYPGIDLVSLHSPPDVAVPERHDAGALELRVTPRLGTRSWDVAFLLPSAGPTEIAIFATSGRLVRGVVSEEMTAGRHSISWNGRDSAGSIAPSGVYLVRLSHPSGQRAQKAVVLR